MRSLKKFAALAVAVFALSAVAAASASAAEFTSTEEGPLTGKALTTQEFTTNGGVIKCTTIDVTGEVTSKASTDQHVTIDYTNCTGPLGVKAEVSPATYTFTSDGTVHILNTITVNMPGLGCKVTVGPQTVTTVAFDNNSGNVIETSNVSGIVYTSSGGLCGSSGTNGTYKGNSEVELVGGGELSFD